MKFKNIKTSDTGDVFVRELSPLLIGPVNGFVTFENHWQYQKVHEELGHWNPDTKQPTDEWYAWREGGMTRVTRKGKGIRTDPQVSKLKKSSANWKPIGAWWNGELIGLIEARKKIYVPYYLELIRKTNALKEMKHMIDNGDNLMIMDLDGPSLESHPIGIVLCSAGYEDIATALNDESRSFGHGWIVAAELAKIDIMSML